MRIHVSGEVGTEAVGGRRAHHILKHGRRWRRVEIDGEGHGIAVGEWCGEIVEQRVEMLTVYVGVGEVGTDRICGCGRIISRNRRWRTFTELWEWRGRNLVFCGIFGLALSSRVRFLITLFENYFGDALKFGTDSQHALDASLLFRNR